MISFNRPYLTGQESAFINKAMTVGKLSGNGPFTKECHDFFSRRYGFKKALLTHSCTAALEMAALLIDITPGDEVIMPSYTFVSTANAFLLRGAKIVFADSSTENPNVAAEEIKKLITASTKAIVVVHYAGVACDMDAIMEVAAQHNLYVIEDAAQAIDSFYKGKPLGSIGHLAAFSFHETKNIISGEGGMLVINDHRFSDRAEILWEKGTNRVAFSRHEVSKYNWVDIGSSFLPSEIIAAFLWAQLNSLDAIQKKRGELWQMYYDKLVILQHEDKVRLPVINAFSTNNAHLFYLVTKTKEEKDAFIIYMREHGVQCVFHYLPLHESPFFKANNSSIAKLTNAERYGNCLVRLPLYFELTPDELNTVVNLIFEFYKK